MSNRFKTSRFHVYHGPDSLFERVRYKFQEERNLKLHGEHFNERLEERAIPEEVISELINFNPKEWKLSTAEVRNDTGKFVNATWEKKIQEQNYWITIGYGDVIQTIIKKDSEGLGFPIVKDGLFYEFVANVNHELMEQEDKGDF